MHKNDGKQKMFSRARNGVEEIFIIKTEQIDFFGAVIKNQDGNSEVYGKVSFGEEMCFFRHPTEEKAVLRKKLESMCKTIAAHYNTDVIHQKYDNAIDVNEVMVLN